VTPDIDELFNGLTPASMMFEPEYEPEFGAEEPAFEEITADEFEFEPEITPDIDELFAALTPASMPVEPEYPEAATEEVFEEPAPVEEAAEEAFEEPAPVEEVVEEVFEVEFGSHAAIGCGSGEEFIDGSRHHGAVVVAGIDGAVGSDVVNANGKGGVAHGMFHGGMANDEVQAVGVLSQRAKG
jgi:hypothetical protein